MEKYIVPFFSFPDDRALESAWHYYDRHREEIDHIIVSHQTTALPQ